MKTDIAKLAGLPAMCGVGTNYVQHLYHQQVASIISIALCFMVAFIFSFSGRYILSNMVTDKETKMRETLRIMGLTQFNYAFSYFTIQGIFSTI
jgi:hypothetical protein